MDTTVARKRIVEEAQQCADNIDYKNHYIRSYPLLLKSTKTLYEELGDAAVPAIAHLAYGWMPTIPKNLNFCKKSSKRVLEALDICSTENSVQYILDWTTPPINNSWVGSSKVLHFINPEAFPIWDSKVAGHFNVNGSSVTKSAECYAQYIHFCKEMADIETAVSTVQAAFIENACYSVSKIRAIEFILFSLK